MCFSKVTPLDLVTSANVYKVSGKTYLKNVSVFEKKQNKTKKINILNKESICSMSSFEVYVLFFKSLVTLANL